MKAARTAICAYVIAAGTLPTQAQSSCPVAEDLEQGIELSQSDPPIHATIWIEDGIYFEGMVTETENGPVIRETERLHYLLLPTRTNGADTSFLVDLSPELPNLLPDVGTVSGPFVREGGTSNEQSGELRLTLIEQSVVQLGQCSYTTWRVLMEQVYDTGPREIVLTYAPELETLIGAEWDGAFRRVYDSISLTSFDISP